MRSWSVLIAHAAGAVERPKKKCMHSQWSCCLTLKAHGLLYALHTSAGLLRTLQPSVG